MSRALAMTAALGAALAVACGTDATGPAADALNEHAAPAFNATHFSISFPIAVDETFDVPCANGGAGENIRITGVAILSIKETVSASGNLALQVHVHPQELIAVGQSSGDVYHAARSPGQVTQIQHADGFPLVVNVLPQPIVLRGNANGSSPATVLIYTHLRLVFDANGELAVFAENLSASCQG